MKNIVAPSAWSRFPEKLICWFVVLLLDQHQALVVQINLLQLAHNFLWNRDNLVAISSTLSYILRSLLSMDKKVFSISHNIVICYFYLLKKIFLSSSFLKDKTKSLFTPWKLGSIGFSDQFRMRLISQLIKIISRVLQKLLMYFNVTAISTFFLLPSAGLFHVTLIWDLNDSEFSVASAGLSL